MLKAAFDIPRPSEMHGPHAHGARARAARTVHGVLCSSNLKLLWRPGDFASATQWRDTVNTAGGNDGAMINGAAQATDLRGRTGVLLDGVNDWCNSGGAVGISGDADYSVCLWLEMRGMANGGIAGWGASGTSLAMAGVYLLSSKPILDFAGGNHIDCPTALVQNAYTFLCVTKAAGALSTSNGKFYFDGVFQGTSTLTGSGTPNITNAAFYVGREADYTGASAYTNLLCSQAMVFNRALSAGEVWALHNYFK